MPFHRRTSTILMAAAAVSTQWWSNDIADSGRLVTAAFSPVVSNIIRTPYGIIRSPIRSASLFSSPNKKSSTTDVLNDFTDNESMLAAETFGGYTVKQRLREEVESPFRQVRLFFFGSTALSALVSFYFSALSTLKASGAVGTFADSVPLEDALTNSGINAAGIVVCGALAFREYRIGQANLARIARGGMLARMMVQPAREGERRRTMSDYRRNSRVLIAAGGEEYIANLAKSLNADQLADTNTLPESLTDADVVVVPVLLRDSKDGASLVGDTRRAWSNTKVTGDEDVSSRNFDVHRADSVLSFPMGNAAWGEYLQTEVDTVVGQGFDPIEKGFTLTIKKNGKILRRATGRPDWRNLVGAMEVLDGSKFGMPGDSERYGGP